LSRRKKLGGQNEEMKEKLFKLSDLANQKERELAVRIAEVQDELFETRAYYEQFQDKIEYEKDRVVEETRIAYEESVEPMRLRFNQNQAEIEDLKDQIRALKLSFESLKEDIVRDVKLVESRAVDESEHEFKMQLSEMKMYLGDLERQNRSLTENFKEKAKMLEEANQSILKSKIEMSQGLEGLKIEEAQLSKLIAEQAMIFDSLSKQRAESKARMEEKIETIEMHKKKIEERLDGFEKEFLAVEKQGDELIDILLKHKEKGVLRVGQLDEAIRKFYTECQVVQERNKVLVQNLQSGFNQVIQGSARFN
jgi:chromosome segregation ATPase